MKRSDNQTYLLTILAAIVVAILIASYFVLHLGNSDPIWANVIAGVVLAILLPMVWHYGFARRGISLSSMQSETRAGAIVSFYPEHSEVDWSAIIDGARRIDIIVRYYGRWVRTNHEAFVRFFERGGELRIVMADPENPDVLNAVHRQFFPNLTSEHLAGKIIDTEERARAAIAEAGSQRARLTTYYFPQALHYSAVLVDGRMLYLSIYEQFRGPNVRSSVFGIDLKKDQELEAYWLQNRESFFEGSRIGVDI